MQISKRIRSLLAVMIFTNLIILVSGKDEVELKQRELSKQMQKAVLGDRNLAEVKKIVEKGFKIDSPIGCGTFSVLDGAVHIADVEMLKYLLQAGATPKGSELLTAVWCDNPEASAKMVEILLAKGVDPNSREYVTAGDKQLLRSALHKAAFRGNTETVAALLASQKIKLNELDADGRTPLMWAVEKGHPAIIEKLLKRGANPNIKNRMGQTAADFARQEILKKEAILGMIQNAETLRSIQRK